MNRNKTRGGWRGEFTSPTIYECHGPRGGLIWHAHLNRDGDAVRAIYEERGRAPCAVLLVPQSGSRESAIDAFHEWIERHERELSEKRGLR